MNDSGEDRILDSFLEEMLTNQRPPDLTEQIQQRLRAELGPARYEQLRSSRIVTQSRKHSASEVRGISISPWTSLSVAVLTLAAGLLLAFGLWKLWPDNLTQIGPQAQKAQPIPTDSNSTPNSITASQNGMAETPRHKEFSPEELPFGTDVPLPELVELPSRPPAAAPVAAIQDKEIIQWLDERFAKLWESQGIHSSDQLDKDQWLTQVSLRLTGGTSRAETSDSPHEMSEKLVRTATFAEMFADQVADYWLKGTPEADPKNPASQQLRVYLAQQIVSKKPWNEVLASLISARPDEPQAVLLSAIASGGNHRLASRIGSLMLDEALACARCHDASDNGRIVSMDQDDYWSLFAIFSGIDGKASKPKDGKSTIHQLVDTQRHLFDGAKLPSVTFERLDGRIQAARYRLPGGDDWRTIEDAQTPRESLARWIDRSSITDQASVNLAWRLVFGRPLVAQHAALDGEGYAQRREILATLAEQFQAHNRDMGQLVTWLVSSRAFARDTLDVDRSRWLSASEDEIVQWGNAAANFAVRLPINTTDNSVKSLESALARIDKWSGSPDARKNTLAQPTLKSDLKPKTIVKSPDSEPHVGYLIHSIKPNHAQRLFINRLVKSKLSWKEQVDHIAGLVGEPAGNARLHDNADELLDAKNGDRVAALFQLLQGALLCHAAM